MGKCAPVPRFTFATTRLEILCKLHRQQGGTIFQFRDKYRLDFLAMTDDDFKRWVNAQVGPVRWCWEHGVWEEK